MQGARRTRGAPVAMTGILDRPLAGPNAPAGSHGGPRRGAHLKHAALDRAGPALLLMLLEQVGAHGAFRDDPRAGRERRAARDVCLVKAGRRSISLLVLHIDQLAAVSAYCQVHFEIRPAKGCFTHLEC